MKKIILLSLAGLICVALLVSISMYAFYSIGVKPAETETVTLGNGETLRVGIISDTQLPPNKGDSTIYRDNLEKALKVLKDQKIEMIIHAGDIADFNSSYAYKTYNEVFDSVFNDEASRPETLYIMGNHDNWWNTDYKSVAPKQRKFTKYIGESPWTHKIVNGFHFIGVSPDGTSNTQGYSDELVKWMDKEIAKAVADTPELPVFVVTHHNPKYTTYGSDVWCDEKIDNVFRKYNNVVSMSGHSHYSILDERSINQNQYTAFTTQGLAYIENETGKFDAFKNKISSIPPNDDQYPMMLIMNVSKEKTTLERWNVKDNKEEKSTMRWTLKHPLVKENFTYSLVQRELTNQAPTMKDSAVTLNPAVKSHLKEPVAGEETLKGISFSAGEDDDFVHSYKVVLRGTKECDFLYFSDFYNGINNMAKTVDLALDKSLPEGEYEVRVYAVDSYGIVSEDFAQGKIVL